MKFVDFSRKPVRVVRCLFGACSVPKTYSSYSSEIEPCPDGRLSSPVGVAEVGKKRVCTMCTPLGFGSGRTGSGLGRIAEVSGERRIFKGRNPVRVPPRARVFPVQGLVGL